MKEGNKNRRYQCFHPRMSPRQILPPLRPTWQGSWCVGDPGRGPGLRPVELKSCSTSLIFASICSCCLVVGAGALQASIGWWCWIDAVAYNSGDMKPEDRVEIGFLYWLPGFFGLIGIVM